RLAVTVAGRLAVTVAGRLAVTGRLAVAGWFAIAGWFAVAAGRVAVTITDLVIGLGLGAVVSAAENGESTGDQDEQRCTRVQLHDDFHLFRVVAHGSRNLQRPIARSSLSERVGGLWRAATEADRVVALAAS